MKTKSTLVSLLGSLSLLAQTQSISATQQYLMWQIPPAGSSYPIYVYQSGKQVSYIASSSMQIFAGAYTPGSTNFSFNLYYRSNGSWFGCGLVISNGNVNTTSTTCPGAVINPPVPTSNVYTVAMAAMAWTATTAPSPTPVALKYDKRTLTFINNTSYQKITIGESCSTKGDHNTAPTCQTNPIIATIDKGKSHMITVGTDGLNSAAFYLTSYCTAASVSDCGPAPTVNQCAADTPPSGWICTGGYFAGQEPYATKIEPTILTVTGGVPAGATNIDVSAVDGFSLGVKLYPASPEYCTYTVPPENSNTLGAGHYDSNNPLAGVVPNSADFLESQCKNSSQLPAGYKGTLKPWNLQKLSSGNKFEGCMSPCTYANINGEASADQFCCNGSYNTPSTCNVATGQIGANTSTYNTNILNSAQFKNVYGFAYGDAGSDYACPPDTNFVIDFIGS